MTENTPPTEPPEPHRGRIRRFEDAVHDRFLAAEVAAEEAAGYGSVTAALEAAEAAVNPERELEETKTDEVTPAPDPPAD